MYGSRSVAPEISSATYRRSVLSSSTPSHPVPIPSVAHGPDGNVWFTEAQANQIVKITPTGTMTAYQVPTPGAWPLFITAGSDGNMWFTEWSDGRPGAVARITPGGTITEYPLKFAPQSIASAGDGDLWVSQSSGFHSVARITTSGRVTYVKIGDRQGGGKVVVGPYGDPWYVVADQFWHVNLPTDKPSQITYIPGNYPAANDMLFAPDHNMWIAESARAAIGVYVRRLEMVTPSSLAFTSIGQQQSVTASETHFIGQFTARGCPPSIVTVSPSGPATTFTVTATGSGTCGLTIADGNGNSEIVAVTVGTVEVRGSKPLAPIIESPRAPSSRRSSTFHG